MLALAAGVAFTSCEDKLDIEQKGVVNIDNFYKTDADCEKALTSAYEYFLIQTMGRTTFGPSIYTPNKVMGNHPGDDVLYAGGNYGDHEFGGSLDEFRYKHTPEAINAMYKGLYSSVYYCNLLLDNVGANASSAFMKQAVAEARVLRAYDYFLLACYWGQPPFVDHQLPADALPANSTMSQKEYFKWVASECEAAYGDLTERKDKSDKAGAYRVTKGFADALAGKAYLFAEDYASAKTALKRVVDSGKYDLVPGSQFANLFHVEGDGNEEKVFEMNMEFNTAVGAWSMGSGLGAFQHSTWMEANCFCWREGHMKTSPINSYNGGLGGWGSIGIPEWYGDAFEANDGDSYRRKATIINVEDAFFLTEEARSEGLKYNDETLNAMTPEQLSQSNEVGIKELDQGFYGNSFWLPFKHLARATDMTDGGGSHGGNLRLNNIIVMRYAEVLLNYAEACIKTGDQATALEILNKIQERAGSAHKSTEATMKELQNEKLWEMWFEGCRFQDILRWDRAGDPAPSGDMNAKARLAQAGSAVPHLYDVKFRPVKSGENPKWLDGKYGKRFYIVHTHEAKDAGFTVGFREGLHNLFPYPSDALDQNPNLKNNPGWDEE